MITIEIFRREVETKQDYCILFCPNKGSFIFIFVGTSNYNSLDRFIHLQHKHS